MSVNEAANMYSPSLSVKFALGVSLTANTIVSLGTERHKKFYDDLWQGKVIFTYDILLRNDNTRIKLLVS